ncbi:hypothetical protein [Methylomonas albis]|nr:hypothetical protein [Methylomonas albis]
MLRLRTIIWRQTNSLMSLKLLYQRQVLAEFAQSALNACEIFQ